MRFHAKSVEDCWKVARRVAEAYQRQMHQAAKKKLSPRYAVCREGRNAADRIAMKIRFGTRRHK